MLPLSLPQYPSSIPPSSSSTPPFPPPLHHLPVPMKSALQTYLYAELRFLHVLSQLQHLGILCIHLLRRQFHWIDILLMINTHFSLHGRYIYQPYRTSSFTPTSKSDSLIKDPPISSNFLWQNADILKVNGQKYFASPLEFLSLSVKVHCRSLSMMSHQYYHP